MNPNGEKSLFPGFESVVEEARKKAKTAKKNGNEPPNLGKAIRLSVPDFAKPDRPATCLEVDFPIAPINALSNLEGNAGKPIYQMSKWWARRRSSVFRSLLIAAGVEAPKDPTQVAKLVWDHYYANHQKAGHFKPLRVLDCFMGGGTTLVEGARLGFQMVGVDLNPVAWFVTKNELACSDPELVRSFFNEIEREVKPLIQPFYVTSCPRGHAGRWVDVRNEQSAKVDPTQLAPAERKNYRWEGPEVIYTFWAKHGPCEAKGCGHRTPVFRTPVVAEKRLTAEYIPVKCPGCGHAFDAELGETRMAPGAERVILPNEPSFTELSQAFGRLLNDYSKGSSGEKKARAVELLGLVDREPGLKCPKCARFAGARLKNILDRHARPAAKLSELRKKEFGIESRHVYLYLLVRPEWLRGAQGVEGEVELGGYAGAPVDRTADWYQLRLADLRFVEVRGRIKLSEEDASPTGDEEEAEVEVEPAEPEVLDEAAERKKYGLPREITLPDGTRLLPRQGTVPKQSTFTCGACGRQQDLLEAVKASGHTAPVMLYALQCYCPTCDAEGINYSGRYFKVPEQSDVERLVMADREWEARSAGELASYWPKEELPYAWMTHHLNGGIPNWGYTHWWKMFNPRQLLVHTQLLRGITEGDEARWPVDVREQALGAFQQYLRNQNMFCFWDVSRDCMAPHLSNANYHPKALVIENCVFQRLGRGNWTSDRDTALEGAVWATAPWESVLPVGEDQKKSSKVQPGDRVLPGTSVLHCGSSTDLSGLGDDKFDLVVTDPPFGDNLFYADLADFFYVWLRIPLLKWYEGAPERKYFEPPFTPKTLEAIRNRAEHPDHRTPEEMEAGVAEPASEFYKETLTACWSEAARLLRPGGLLAFTFHHSADEPWIDVLESLFNAGYILVATYPIRSDETKGAGGAFGSRKIEYDIVHVCRKRVEAPAPVSWARMRRWVKEEVIRLRNLLELYRLAALPPSDIRVILRGKALEFYSRHYGQVLTGDGEVLSVRDALLGINQLLDDEDDPSAKRPPDEAEPTSRLFLRLFTGRPSLPRDELGKYLRGTGISPGELEAKGWIRSVGTTIHVLPIAERFQFFTAPGRNRKVLKTDLDQAHFLIGAATPNSGINIGEELDRATLKLKRSVDAILKWYALTDLDPKMRQAATIAGNLVDHWRTQAKTKAASAPAQMTLFEKLEAEE